MASAAPAPGAPFVAPGPLPHAGGPLWLELARHLDGVRRTRPPAIVEDGAVDLLRLGLDVQVGGDGRTVDATAVLTVRANGSTGDAFFLWLDEGLAFTSASAPEVDVRVDTQEHPPFVYGVVGFSPRLTAGETVEVVLTYGGQLVCGPYGPRESRYCGGDGELAYYMASGLFPLVMDFADPYGALAYELDLTLRTPADLEVLVAADPVSEAVDGAWRVSTWHAPVYTSGMNLILLTGQFDVIPVPRVAPPTTVQHLTGHGEYAGTMAEWIPTIYGFLEELAGGPFPFGQVTVFKLPIMDGFPGTATHGMVYLSDAYATSNMGWFEEILAHEISHLWWGILAAPVDLSRTALMTEGLAVTSQYEYIRRQHFLQVDADWVLWSKFRRNQILLWYLTDPETLPPILLAEGAAWPGTVNEQVVWAYYKTSSFLDLLRVALGDETFFAALRDYVAACTHGECGFDDVEAIFGQRAGADLSPWFDAFARGTSFPGLGIAFVPCVEGAAPCESRVTLSKDLDTTLPVELFLEDENGGVIHRALVELADPVADFAFTTDGRPVRAVVNPRLQAFYRVASDAPGDVNFDGETDGFDWMEVVLAQGRRAVQDVPNPGLYDIDERFETRLDVVTDGVVDDSDLEVLRAGFGAVAGGGR